MIQRNNKFITVLNYIINFFLFAASFFMVTIILSISVDAEEQNATTIVEVIGTGIIYQKDVEAARTEAISNSLVSAVDLAVADLLPIDSLVQNFSRLNDILYSQTDKYICDYKVFTELKIENIYRVLVQATIFIDKIKKNLSESGIIYAKKTLPRILLIIKEKNQEKVLHRYLWEEDIAFAGSVGENSIAKTMREKGFKVIEYKSIISDIDIDAIDSTDINDLKALNLGTRLQADVVIIGRSVAHKTANTMGEGIRSFKGIITARAFKIDSGEEIAATIQTATAVNSDEISGNREALSSAGTLAGNDLASQIMTMSLKENMNITKLEITVGGTQNLANFVMFRKFLDDLPEVHEIRTKEMRPDEAAIIINYQGNARELADAMMLKTFESFGIKIYGITQNNLRLELIPNLHQSRGSS